MLVHNKSRNKMQPHPGALHVRMLDHKQMPRLMTTYCALEEVWHHIQLCTNKIACFCKSMRGELKEDANLGGLFMDNLVTL